MMISLLYCYDDDIIRDKNKIYDMFNKFKYDMENNIDNLGKDTYGKRK